MADWVAQTLPTGAAPEGWQAACWDGTYFHLFDDSGGIALRSATAAVGTWASVAYPAIETRAASGFGTTVVAVGASGNMARSSNNGTSWTADTMPTAHHWVSVVNNGARFVAITDNGAAANKAAYSDDGGATWTAVAIPGASVNWRTVLWTGTKFVAIGYDGPNDRGVCSTSNDGATWSAAAVIYGPSYDPIWAANIGPVIVVVAHVPTFETVRSTDHGATWTRVDTGLTLLNSGNTIGIHAGADGFYVLGYDIAQPLHSVDGVTWTNANLPVGVPQGYFLPPAQCGNGTINVAASNYQAGLAITIGTAPPTTPTTSPFFHFTF
jgi:hypothetical protein